jgi:hypothetical protein
LGRLTEQVFNESCCDGGVSSPHKSAQPCGCDEGARWTCARHLKEQAEAKSSAVPSVGSSAGSFQVKDSGQRMEFESGMVRDLAEGKVDYSLIYDGPMLDRWAEHLTKGAVKYAVRNWMKARGQEEYERFRSSAARHFRQWFRGDIDEDHAAAVYFNLNGAEYVRAFLLREG